MVTVTTPPMDPIPLSVVVVGEGAMVGVIGDGVDVGAGVVVVVVVVVVLGKKPRTEGIVCVFVLFLQSRIVSSNRLVV